MRECGGCTLCCKLVKVEELNKPQNVWCEHCEIGVGCRIHETRPPGCRSFDCLWRQELIPEAFKPDSCKAVFSVTGDGKRIQVFIDPARPLAYKEGLLGEWIKGAVEAGMDFIVINGDKRVLLTSNPETLARFGLLQEELRAKENPEPSQG